MIEGTMKTRHLVLSERNMDVPGCRIAGSAYRVEDDEHFTLHLRILPGMTFFVVKNKKGFPEYLVFSGRAKKEPGKYRFFHKIGTGHENRLDNLLSVSLPDLNQTYHIQLESEDLHFTEPAA